MNLKWKQRNSKRKFSHIISKTLIFQWRQVHRWESRWLIGAHLSQASVYNPYKVWALPGLLVKTPCNNPLRSFNEVGPYSHKSWNVRVLTQPVVSHFLVINMSHRDGRPIHKSLRKSTLNPEKSQRENVNGRSVETPVRWKLIDIMCPWSRIEVQTTAEECCNSLTTWTRCCGRLMTEIGFVFQETCSCPLNGNQAVNVIPLLDLRIRSMYT